jgi:hypothetical protein
VAVAAVATVATAIHSVNRSDVGDERPCVLHDSRRPGRVRLKAAHAGGKRRGELVNAPGVSRLRGHIFFFLKKTCLKNKTRGKNTSRAHQKGKKKKPGAKTPTRAHKNEKKKKKKKKKQTIF